MPPCLSFRFRPRLAWVAVASDGKKLLLRRRCGYDDDCARRGCDGRELPQLVCGGGGKKLCGCR